jgi:hypothetical protein
MLVKSFDVAKYICIQRCNATEGFGGSRGPFFPQAETPSPATSAATTNKRMII